jgi:hypothetical protein
MGNSSGKISNVLPTRPSSKHNDPNDPNSAAAIAEANRPKTSTGLRGGVNDVP